MQRCILKVCCTHCMIQVLEICLESLSSPTLMISPHLLNCSHTRANNKRDIAQLNPLRSAILCSNTNSTYLNVICRFEAHILPGYIHANCIHPLFSSRCIHTLLLEGLKHTHMFASHGSRSLLSHPHDDIQQTHICRAIWLTRRPN